jgi:hypothetical protein
MIVMIRCSNLTSIPSRPPFRSDPRASFLNPNEFKPRRESADAEDQNGDVFAAVGLKLAVSRYSRSRQSSMVPKLIADEIRKLLNRK